MPVFGEGVAGVDEELRADRAGDREAVLGVEDEERASAERRRRVACRSIEDVDQRRTAALIDRLLRRTGGAEEVERIGAVGCVAAGREALGQRHAARRNDLAGIGIDRRAGAEVLDQTDAARHRERAAVADRQVPRRLRELLQEARVRGDQRERVLDRGGGEEAAMRIDRDRRVCPRRTSA